MNALKYLQELDYLDKRKRYPSLPEHAIARTRFSDKSANDLTRAILRFLELHGHWATRVNSTGRKLKDTHIVDVIGRGRTIPGRWIPGTTRRGTADIHSVINSRHVSIEVKVGRDTMSPEQRKAKEAIEKAGGIYYIARSFQGFHEWYNELVQ
jgi:Holliday junction resolvase